MTISFVSESPSAPPPGGALTLTLEERIVLRRATRKTAYLQAVQREATRIAEDIIVPEVLRAADESNHSEDMNVLVPHIGVSPTPKELPKSYKRSVFEEDVRDAVLALIHAKGLPHCELTLEHRFENLLACTLFSLPFFCTPAPQTFPAERCLTFTCSVSSEGTFGGGGGSSKLRCLGARA